MFARKVNLHIMNGRMIKVNENKRKNKSLPRNHRKQINFFPSSFLYGSIVEASEWKFLIKNLWIYKSRKQQKKRKLRAIPKLLYLSWKNLFERIKQKQKSWKIIKLLSANEYLKIQFRNLFVKSALLNETH